MKQLVVLSLFVAPVAIYLGFISLLVPKNSALADEEHKFTRSVRVEKTIKRPDVDIKQYHRTMKLLTACPDPATYLSCKARFEELENLAVIAHCRYTHARFPKCVPESLCKSVNYPQELGYYACEPRMEVSNGN